MIVALFVLVQFMIITIDLFMAHKINRHYPPPPQSTDPINFAVRADAFVSAIDNLQVEINTWASQANTTQTQINASQTDVSNIKDDVIDDEFNVGGIF